MKTIALRTADGRWIAREVRFACSFVARSRALLQAGAIGPQDAVLLSPGRHVHTFGWRAPADFVFLTRQMRVLALVAGVRPWRFRSAPAGTGRVLVLAGGKIAATGLRPGIYLLVESGSDEVHRPSECSTRGLHTARRPCERSPIQFSLRLPLQRRCAGGQPTSVPIQPRSMER